MAKSLARPFEFVRGWDRRDLAWRASLLLAAALAAGYFAWQVSAPRGQDPASLSQAAFVAQTGVRIVRVAVTAGGGLVDVRYQVVDPDKALVIHDERNPPTVVDAATGQALSIPFHKHPSRRELHAAVTYSELLLNSGGLVKRGGVVTVILGGFSLENVVVK